jgi:hypothetical protein
VALSVSCQSLSNGSGKQNDQQEPKIEHCPSNRRLYQQHRSKADVTLLNFDVRFTPESGD